jgi:hypothetical protein
LLNVLLVASEALAFGVASLIFLTIVGLGITELLLPAEGFQMLLAPAVGLAVLALGFQWLAFFVPPFVAALVVVVAFGALTAVVVWRRRTKLLARWPDLVGAAVLLLAFFVALLAIDIARGYFTLGGFPSDNVFIYAQSAQYLLDHAMPLPHQALSVVSPGSVSLATGGIAFPNSVGAVDAAASVLSGWPVYALFDLINALALAITVGPVWFFVRAALGASWPVAAAAGGLLATNQLLYWVIGNGFQQESLALPIFSAGLGAAGFAVRTQSARAGALTGVMGASLIGLYLPIAVLLALCSAGCLLVRLVVDRKASWRGLVRPVALAVASGVVVGLASIFVLLFEGGLSIWVNIAGVRVPAGGISRFPLVPYLLGTLPFAHVWEPLRQPFGTLDWLTLPLLVLGSALLVVLLVLGYARATIQLHAQEAAILGAGLLFVGYEAAVARYPYGFVKSIGYVVPLTSAFVAFGGIGLESVFRPGLRRSAQVAGVGALAVVLLASALASRDMVRLWLEAPGLPTFPHTYIALSGFATDIPVGASVLIDDPVPDYATLVRIAAIAYFLPDRSVRVYSGSYRKGTFPDQDVRPGPCAFDYVISPVPPAGGSSLVYTDQTGGLHTYKRAGASCSSR